MHTTINKQDEQIHVEFDKQYLVKDENVLNLQNMYLCTGKNPNS